MAQPLADQSPAEQHAARNAAIVALAAQQLAAAWPQIDWNSPQAVDAVKRLYAAIVTRYGQASAAVAAEFYDSLREQAIPEAKKFRATPADPLPIEQLDRVVESAFLGTAADTEPRVSVTVSGETTSDLPVQERVPARLESSLQRHVQQPGRDTIAQASDADPQAVGYVRVPKGDNPCAFCIMLASRKIMYLTKKSASRVVGRGGKERLNETITPNRKAQPMGEKYHYDCHCEPVPVFRGQSIKDVSPNLADYQEMYGKAVADAGTSADARKILSAMRSLYKLR